MKKWIETDQYGNIYHHAIIDGYKRLHNASGPAMEFMDGSIYYYLNGLPHRLDGPAVDSFLGVKKWYKNGELHRTDGPAVEFNNKSIGMYMMWYIDGEFIDCNNNEEFLRIYRLKIFL